MQITKSPLTIQADFGHHIKEVIKKAIDLAKAEKQMVRFTFNDVDICVTETDTVDEVYKAWDDQLAEWHREYELSPQGIAAAKALKDKVSAYQADVDRLTFTLPEVLRENKDAALMEWCRDFAEKGDLVGVKIDHEKVYQTFKRVGYEANWGVGKPKDFFMIRPNMARYIVGQVMTFLSREMNPHPMTITFVERYFAL